MISQLLASGLPGSAVLPDVSVAQIADKPPNDQAQLSVGPRILVVDDDVPLGNFLSRELKRSRFSVDVRLNGEAACDGISECAYDLLILDLNLPRMDGMAVIKQVRLSQPQLPILVLTARNHTGDMVSALEGGADDYLIKPFSLLELLARVRSLLRRSTNLAVGSTNVGSLIMSREEHWVMRGERRIDLTAREFSLLGYLMNNAGKAISRKTLMEDVWNVPYDSTTNIVDVYMKYLRDKVDLEGEVKLIRTVRGVGYVLNNE